MLSVCIHMLPLQLPVGPTPLVADHYDGGPFNAAYAGYAARAYEHQVFLVITFSEIYFILYCAQNFLE